MSNTKKNSHHWKKSHEDAERLWELSGEYKSSYKPDIEKGLARFKSKTYSDAKETTKVVKLNSSRRRWLNIAAAVVLVLGFSFVWKNFMQETTTIGIAEAGEQTEIHLADGTMVFLNQNSRLEYPNSFDGQAKRSVRLIGEAYFKVAHNPAQPFVITTQQSAVTVLGTSFNLRAYPNENFTEVEVETGKVAFSSKGNKQKILLTANEKGFLRHGKAPQKEGAENLNAQVWRTGKLVFKNIDFATAVHLLERRFNVTIEISPALKNKKLTNSVGKESKIADVFAAMEKAYGVRVSQKTDGTFVIK